MAVAELGRGLSALLFHVLLINLTMLCCIMQLELLAALVAAGELEREYVRSVSALLADSSHAIRHAASGLVARLLLESAEQRAKVCS